MHNIGKLTRYENLSFDQFDDILTTRIIKRFNDYIQYCHQKEIFEVK
jgi:predicted HTH domain antitoxin